MAMDVMATVMKLQTVVDADTHGLAFSRISQRKCETQNCPAHSKCCVDNIDYVTSSKEMKSLKSSTFSFNAY